MLMEEDLFDGWLAMPAFTDVSECSTSIVCRPTTNEVIQTSSQISCKIGSVRMDRDTEVTDQLHTATDPSMPPACRAPRQRRGHTKSRLGCISCKKRKVKCQETWPSCANCTKRGTICRYPMPFQQAQYHRSSSELVSPMQFVKLSDTPTPFKVNDLRLFHHYLVSAYPSIPHGCEGVWISEVPKYCHHYFYLMEAMLAVAGSHVSLLVDEPDAKSALLHRQKAINGLEEAFTRWPPSAEEAHIMLATSYLLCFQSAYIEDGFLEHFLSLRGCAFLSQLISGEDLNGPFTVQVNMHTSLLEHTLRNHPHLDHDLACEALQSIKLFHHLVAPTDTTSVEKALVTQFVETLQPLLSSGVKITDPFSDNEVVEGSVFSPSSTTGHLFIQNPLFDTDLTAVFENIDWTNITSPPYPTPDPIRSFNALMASLLILSNCEHDDLIRLFDPKNQLSNIIMAHFLTVRIITTPLASPPTAMRTPISALVKWTERVVDAIEDDAEDGVKWTKYAAWPRKVLRCALECVKQNRGLSFSDVYDVLVYDPGAFKEGRGRL